MDMLDLVLYGYHGKVGGRNSMDSLCLQNNVDTGVDDGTATSGKVTCQVSTNGTPDDDEDEFYDSVDELDEKEVKYSRKEDGLKNQEPKNRNVRDVELKLENEDGERVEDRPLLKATASKSSELAFEDADDEIPEVIDETPVSEAEEPVSEDHVSDPEEGTRSDDGSGKSTIDTNDKGRKMSPKTSKGRKKSANRGGGKNSNANQMTCEKLQKIKDNVEKAIRVSTYIFLYM